MLSLSLSTYVDFNLVFNHVWGFTNILITIIRTEFVYVEWIVLLPFVNCSFFCSLDTFPYAGTTTTCESLYMGVPCVTMAGSVHAHNVGVSLLSNVGMESTLIFVFDVDFNIFCITITSR